MAYVLSYHTISYVANNNDVVVIYAQQDNPFRINRGKEPWTYCNAP